MGMASMQVTVSVLSVPNRKLFASTHQCGVTV